MAILTLDFRHPLHNTYTIGSLGHKNDILRFAKEALELVLKGSEQSADDANINLIGHELVIYGVWFDNGLFFQAYEYVLDHYLEVLQDNY
jgi:hypothetical protein